MASKAPARGRETLDKLDDILFEAAVVIKVRKKDLVKRPDDVEALHQYRVSIRVARSLVKFLAPYQEREQNRRLRGALKQLQDPTSRVRELDVLVPELDGHPDLQALCSRARSEARDAFNAGLDKRGAREALELADRELRDIHWRKRVRKRGVDPDELASRIEDRRRRCEALLSAIDFDDQEAVHDLRKQAKALRYVSRELAQCLPEETGAISGSMREVQDKLGEWCDARVDASLVSETCGARGAAVADEFQDKARSIMRDLERARD